ADEDAASLAAEAADIEAEADMSAADAAAADESAADDAAASAAGAVVVVSAGLLQAARAKAATREANRSDFFMNILEENWVRTITGILDTRPHSRHSSQKTAGKARAFPCA